MRTNVLQYLEETVIRVPDKLCFADEEQQLTFREVSEEARRVGSAMARAIGSGKPVLVAMRRSPRMIVAFLATIYAGCFAVPIDEEMPPIRIRQIIDITKPALCLYETATEPALQAYAIQAPVHTYESLVAEPADASVLARVRARQLDVDPIYVVFTSGSTGVPKGVIANHRSVLDYIENLSEVLRVDADTVFGNQSPLYFDACLKEIYPTLKFGATAWLIPKQLFLFPLRLVEYLNEKGINTICWVVSALTLISGFGVLKQLRPASLRTIAFGSEVFPIQQFRLWREALPEARFINLYGPTEATGMSCWYEVDRDFGLNDAIPIGQPFRNTEILLIREDGSAAEPGETGEMYIRGTCVTLGYYRDSERTSQAFVQNPLHSDYPELVYRTGDLGRLNERGELVFCARRDHQIKHMGYRVELGEIEAAALSVPGVRQACCVYDQERRKIVLFFAGEMTAADLSKSLRDLLPRYMLPNRLESMERLPLTANGKIDRVQLQAKAQA